MVDGARAQLQELGEAAFMVLLTEYNLIIRPALVASRGREVKHTRDGIMASFDDVVHALECSVAIQDGFDARTRERGAPELQVRIGMAAGEPVDHNDDMFGSAVILASRICDAADRSDNRHHISMKKDHVSRGWRDWLVTRPGSVEQRSSLLLVHHGPVDGRIPSMHPGERRVTAHLSRRLDGQR